MSEHARTHTDPPNQHNTHTTHNKQTSGVRFANVQYGGVPKVDILLSKLNIKVKPTNGTVGYRPGFAYGCGREFLCVCLCGLAFLVSLVSRVESPH